MERRIQFCFGFFGFFFTPAGADSHPLTGGGVGDGSVVVDQGGVESHAVDVQGHRGKLHAERKVMPLAVTHLEHRGDGVRGPEVPRSRLINDAGVWGRGGGPFIA